MGQTRQQPYTQPLTSALTILESDSVIAFSILPVSGACTITGGRSFRGVASTPITVPEGTPYTERAPAGYVLDGYTITPAGTTNIVLLF